MFYTLSALTIFVKPQDVYMYNGHEHFERYISRSSFKYVNNRGAHCIHNENELGVLLAHIVNLYLNYIFMHKTQSRKPWKKYIYDYMNLKATQYAN